MEAMKTYDLHDCEMSVQKLRTNDNDEQAWSL